MEMSEEEFDALTYIGYGITLPHRGGSASDDVAEDRDVYNLSEFERESFYTLFTLIRTPSGRAITVDAQGYNYMRYAGLLSHYKNLDGYRLHKGYSTATYRRARGECREAGQQYQGYQGGGSREDPYRKYCCLVNIVKLLIINYILKGKPLLKKK